MTAPKSLRDQLLEVVGVSDVLDDWHLREGDCPRCGLREANTRWDVCPECAAAEGWDPHCDACDLEAEGKDAAGVEHVDTCAGAMAGSRCRVEE